MSNSTFILLKTSISFQKYSLQGYDISIIFVKEISMHSINMSISTIPVPARLQHVLTEPWLCLVVI